MVDLTPSQFAKNILDASVKSKIIKSLNIDIHEDVVVKSRVFLIDASFIDVYYNSDTRRVAYALIKNQKRIFGADNTGGWHIHTFENPEEHKKCSEVTFKEFVGKIEKQMKTNE